MSQKSPRYNLYRDFVDAYMKSHFEMTRCESHHNAQTEWNEIKKDQDLVQEKISQYLAKWNNAGRPETPPKKTSKQKSITPKRNSQKRTFSSDDDTQNDDPNIIKLKTPTSSKRQATSSTGLIELDDELKLKEKSPTINSTETTPKKTVRTPNSEKNKTPAQETILNDLTTISERIENLIQVKSMGLLTAENQRTLKKLIEQKKERTANLKRLQARQLASTRYREKQKRNIEKLCISNPEIATEFSQVFRSSTARTPMDTACPDLLQILDEFANFGETNDDQPKTSLSLDKLKNTLQERGYQIHKTSSYYRLMLQRSLSHDGKKHIVTVPVRLRKMQGINILPKHEDSYYTTASLRHIKDLAGIFGNDCVFYLTQNTKAKINIGRSSNKGQSPLLMHLDYQISSTESQSNSIVPTHQLTPCVYAASVIDELGALTHTGPTYVSIRSAKHDRLIHESHSIDFDRLIKLKEFEKVACDHHGSVKPVVIINIDSYGSENNTRYLKTLSTAINRFRKYNLDALIMINQAPGQTLFNTVDRRLSPLAQDLAGLILPYDNFGTYLNEDGLTKHVELEKENFQSIGNILAEVWNMNILDEHPVVAEYVKPSPLIDEQLKMVDSTLTLDSIVDQVCASEGETMDEQVHQSRPTIPLTEIKTECEIDEHWCAIHVLQTEYTIQIIRCNNPSCCTPWRSNYIQVFPHRFLPPPVPFHRSSRGVKMTTIEASSALTNSISPFYGNLFQRIQFHGIVLNHTHNDMLPFDAYCPSIKTKVSSRICTICQQYIPISIRLRNHYKIHQQYSTDLINKEEIISDENDFPDDPYDMPIKLTEKSVHLFTNIMEWLKSDFEDEPIVDVKTKSVAATANAMIRQEKQKEATKTIEAEQSTTTTTTTIQEGQSTTTTIQEEQSTTLEITCLNESQPENGNILDALEQLVMVDEDINNLNETNTSSEQSWDDLEELIDTI